MVQTCVVCKSTNDLGDMGLKFHQIPKEERRKLQWCKALNLKDVKISTRICSNHFKKEDYIFSSMSQRLYLKKDAIPCMYKSETEETAIQKIMSENNSIINQDSINNKDKSLENTDSCSSVTNEEKVVEQVGQQKKFNSSIDKNEPPKKRIRTFKDINAIEVSKDPDEARICLEVALETIYEQKRKIHLLQKQNIRLQRKVKDFDALMAVLKEHSSLISDTAYTFSNSNST